MTSSSVSPCSAIGTTRWADSVSSTRRTMAVSTVIRPADRRSDPGRDRRADPALRPLAAPLEDELLELEHPVDEAFGPGWTARDVDIDGHDPVDALDGRV